MRVGKIRNLYLRRAAIVVMYSITMPIALIGVALALTVALLVHGLRVHLSKTVTTTATPEKPS